MYNKETTKLLEELKASTGYIPVSDLAARFEEIDEYYNHEPWNLQQILANINLIVSIELEKQYDTEEAIK